MDEIKGRIGGQSHATQSMVISVFFLTVTHVTRWANRPLNP